ncbi:MAG TPA: hypothetical protein VHD61_07675 [Lacunisphaera sp.]|nr:hypothetical protein [Lacunisphaera sp.]
MPRTRHLLLPLALVLVSGCAGTATTNQAEQAKNKKESEYVYYTPTGSNIPVRIRKDLLQSSAAETSSDQEAIRNLQIKGQKSPKGD